MSGSPSRCPWIARTPAGSAGGSAGSGCHSSSSSAPGGRGRSALRIVCWDRDAGKVSANSLHISFRIRTICMYMYMCPCTYMYMCACTYVCGYAECTYMYMCACTYVCGYAACTYVHTYVHITCTFTVSPPCTVSTCTHVPKHHLPDIIQANLITECHKHLILHSTDLPF